MRDCCKLLIFISIGRPAAAFGHKKPPSRGRKQPIRVTISFMLNGLPVNPAAENSKLPAAILNNIRSADSVSTVSIVNVNCGKDIKFQSNELEIEGRFSRMPY